MESLSEEIWDVVIAGTSLPQALLALALSRSGKKILHVDRHEYYGGDDAGLSLQDAGTWTEDNEKNGSTTFNRPIISETASQSNGATLGPSRSYTLSLNPQIIYAQSSFLPSLVSSQIHTQLEFLAVGAWWIFRDARLYKIPGGREDVFTDETLSRKDKVALMKFLRFALQDEEEGELTQDEQETLQDALVRKFKIPQHLHAPLLALALSDDPALTTPFSTAIRRIRRHMRSIGYFGPGFGAVVAKYAGNAELAQVACRASAVGGAVYLLGHGIAEIDLAEESQPQEDQSKALIGIRLSDGTKVRARRVVGSPDDIPQLSARSLLEYQSAASPVLCSITIIADELRHLFPQTADNGPVPAVALVLVEDRDGDLVSPPMYLQIHSEDTGECPSGQCVIYGSTTWVDDTSRSRLENAVQSVAKSAQAEDSAAVLWSMSYIKAEPKLEAETSRDGAVNPGQVSRFRLRAHDIALNDDVLEDVKAVWTKILGPEAADHEFLRFEAREQQADIE